MNQYGTYIYLHGCVNVSVWSAVHELKLVKDNKISKFHAQPVKSVGLSIEKTRVDLCWFTFPFI